MLLITVLFSFLFCQTFVQSEFFYELDGFQYLFSGPFMSDWFTAYQYCRYRGMVLIDVPTYKEQERLVNLINMTPYKNNSYFWTCGNDLSREGHFIWMTTGHSIVFTNWYTNQPDNANKNENCLSLTYTDKFKWNDAPCNQINHFICRDKPIDAHILM